MLLFRNAILLSACVVVITLAQTSNEVVLRSFAYAPTGGTPCGGVTRGAAGNLYGTATYGGNFNRGVVYKLALNGTLTVLHSFAGGLDGNEPCTEVALDSAGNVYGTTGTGGAANAGTVYKVDASGNETVLYSFTGRSDGGGPYGGVILDAAGNLYGTTCHGGTKAGVVYKLDPAGSETVLYNFTGGNDGGCPMSAVIRASGRLYGTTKFGGRYRSGTVYALGNDGRETVLYSFEGGIDGCHPRTGVVRDSAGNFYGTTNACGGADLGTAYKIDTTGQETVLRSFTGKNGAVPQSGVVLDAAGNLYGTTHGAGPGGAGIVYKLDPAGNETILYAFTGGTDGGGANGQVVLDSAGSLYGATEGGGVYGTVNLGVIFKVSQTGQESVLYSFPAAAGGTGPAGVIRDSAGTLYGVTAQGGSANLGTVYKLDAAGNETVLHNFLGGIDGSHPNAGLVSDAAGNLYGTTLFGGIGNVGVVYKVDANGHQTVLYSFTGPYPDGSLPNAGLTLDAAGNLYGTTNRGGTHSDGGTIFKIDPSGNETVLYEFGLGSGGEWPYSGVTFDSAGNLYGTTSAGGVSGSISTGTVYQLSPSGQYTVLYSFTGQADGGAPYAGVILDSAGNLYGTTQFGGSVNNRGVVYEVDPAGHETVLYTFSGGNDGGNPMSGVIRDAAGNLYGTTFKGGSADAGVVYKLNSSGQQTILYTFTGLDGDLPSSGVIADRAGNLYGTTESGGAYGGTQGSGVIFKILGAYGQ